MAENKRENATLVNFRVDQTVKESAEAVLSAMGLNLSSYIGMCLRQVAQDRKVPFTPNVNPEFWMAENAVSNVMSLINSGIFSKAATVSFDIEKEVSMNIMAFSRGENRHAYKIALITGFDISKQYGLYEALDVVNFYVDGGDGEDKEEFRAFTADMRNLILERCKGFLKDSNYSTDGLSDSEIIKKFDSFIETPVYAYDNYPSNLSLRFSGNGADMGVYEEIAKISKEWKETKEKKDRENSAKNNVTNSANNGGEEDMTEIVKALALMKMMEESE